MKSTSDSPRAARGYRGALRRLCHDRGAATAIIVAITVPIMAAIAGLGVDIGWWFTVKRQNQSAADAAALSAAYEVMQNTTHQLTAAQTAATKNGYTGSALAAGCSGTSYLCTSYSYGPVNNGIAVVLQQRQNGWFSNFAELAGATIVNRAIALVGTLGPACIDATSPNAAIGIGVVGSSQINTPNCILWSTTNSASAIYVQGSANAIINAQSMVTADQLSTTGSPVITLSDPAQFGVAQNLLVNPYAPNGSGTCTGTPCLTHSFLTQGMPACITDPNPKGGTTSYTAPKCFSGLTLGPGGGGTTVTSDPAPTGSPTAI
jgi:Flp pilus assembly protein TadG